MDTGEATLTGSGSHSERQASPPVWKLRLVYTASAGVLKTGPTLWDVEGPLGIGRRHAASPAEPWQRIEDGSVSREHARLYPDGSRVYVEDLKSKNGTFWNGTQLQAGESKPIQDGDILRLGDSFVVVRHEPRDELDAPVSSLIGISRASCLIRCAIARCTVSERCVLILGESGTGKGVIAEAIHRLSQRRGKLVLVNCAAIPATLAEAQLFGVARGAFTGATPHGGFFGEAHQGTLFLDEVGELPLELQPKFLHALETKRVTPVGGQRPIACDARILAATNRDLADALRRKTFREDLYARLTGEIIQVPPLRERREDILLLARHFIGPDPAFSPQLVAALLAYPFRLNVREVSNVIGRLRDRSEEEVWKSLSSAPTLSKASVSVPSRDQVMALLAEYRGNLRRIEIERGYSRRQLHRFIEKYGLDLDQYRRST
jgi:transcriptional regulator with PAS, ATPase and Fis domain